MSKVTTAAGFIRNCTLWSAEGLMHWKSNRESTTGKHLGLIGFLNSWHASEFRMKSCYRKSPSVTKFGLKRFAFAREGGWQVGRQIAA